MISEILDILKVRKAGWLNWISDRVSGQARAVGYVRPFDRLRSNSLGLFCVYVVVTIASRRVKVNL